MPNIRAVVPVIGLIASVSIGTGIGLASAAPSGRAHAITAAAATGHAPSRLGRPAGAQVIPATPTDLLSTTYLTGVYCTSRRDCWAVGLRQAASDVILNQVLHWTGKSWVRVPAPNPGGTRAGHVSELTGVRCATARDCWAVGYYGDASGKSRNEALHWNGRAWFATRTPQPASTGMQPQNYLTDVTCVTARNCWAVGYFRTSTSAALNQVLHWNGKKWSRLRAPEPGGSTPQSMNELFGVRCPTSSRCLAVGTYSPHGIGGAGGTFNQVLFWTGRAWVNQHVPTPGTGPQYSSALYGLGCGARNSCWAVGSYGSAPGQFLDQVMHWNGRAWSRQFTSQPAGTGRASENQLGWVTCNSNQNCWAVGSYRQLNPGAMGRNQAQHWNGKHWILVHTPDPAGTGLGDQDALYGARCTDGTNCWAVGAKIQKGAATNEILHWNGKKWSV